MPAIVLASGSRYRAALLARLGLAFQAIAPDIDESALPGEDAEALVTRLSLAKARAAAARAPGALVIGSDQVGELDGHFLSKPGTEYAAIAQLGRAAGRSVRFLTGLCVLDAASGRHAGATVQCTVRFRPLREAQIRDYVRREHPLDCAGSFKVEGLGIALFEKLELDDPTALEGLPLIRLTDLLAGFGVPVLGH